MGATFLGYAPIFLRKKKDRLELTSPSPITASERPSLRFFVAGDYIFIQSVIKARTANSGANAGHLCVYNITALPAIIL